MGRGGGRLRRVIKATMCRKQSARARGEEKSSSVRKNDGVIVKHKLKQRRNLEEEKRKEKS